MQNFRVVVIFLMLTSAVQVVQVQGEGKQAGMLGTSNKTLETSTAMSGLSLLTTDLSTSTADQDWVTFPPGDVLNDPWFKKIKFVFPRNETLLQGIRNAWPYVYPLSGVSGGEVFHGTRILNKVKEIAVDPVLRVKLFCFIIVHQSVKDSVRCFPGNSKMFSDRWHDSPIGMMRDNIPLSVLNAMLAFLSMMLGIFGNILIIISIMTKKELNTSTNLILVGIAVADSLNSVTIVFHGYLETFLWTITNPVLGPYGCGIINTLKQLSQLSAVNHLITLSFERYFAICWPTKDSLKFTKKKTVLVIIMNWIISGIQLVPYVILRVPVDGLDYAEYMCHGTTDYPLWMYIIYSLTVYLVLPVPILCFNYICVVRSLLTSIKRSRNVTDMTAETSWQTKAEKARLKMIYMLITLVVIYVLTVTPGRILNILVDLRIVEFHGVFYIKKVGGTFDMLRGMNSWTNVVVYALISRHFRTAFKEVLCNSCRKLPVGNPGQGNQNGIDETLAETVQNQV